MTRAEACEILGISQNAEKNEIKKRYRQLMMQVHPDAALSTSIIADGLTHIPYETSTDMTLKKKYGYSAQEINAAYAYLVKGRSSFGEGTSHSKSCHSKESKRNSVWDAPVNVNAYREREVLQYVEDYEGAVIGNFCVAKGKYLWKTEEDFPLFLLSIYRCGKCLLDEIDEKGSRGDSLEIRQQILPELTYLLAQQYIDAAALLKELAREENTDRGGDGIFYISSMLELSDGAAFSKEGEMVYPSRLKQHRLYLKNRKGQELGYLSFHDDRLYYVVVPLFEQKRVRVKMQAAGGKIFKKRKARGYQNLHLWIKLSDVNGTRMPESLNLQIEQLLEQYRRMS